MRHAEDATVSNPEAGVLSKAGDDVHLGIDHFLLTPLELGSESLRSRNTSCEFARWSDIVDDVGGVRIVNEQAESFADAFARLINGASAGVASFHLRDFNGPSAVWITFIHSDILHFFNPPFPRHGGRSR
jgi:hypothetical protein